MLQMATLRCGSHSIRKILTSKGIFSLKDINASSPNNKIANNPNSVVNFAKLFDASRVFKYKTVGLDAGISNLNLLKYYKNE